MKFYPRWKWLTAAVLCVALILAAGCGPTAAPKAANQAVGQQLTIKVLDVGQGDAVLIRAGDKITLIDTGDIPTRDKLITYLKNAGVTAIDNVIITHPHADHLGGMPAVLEHFTVKQIYDSGQTTTTALYRQYLAAVEKKKIPFTVLKAGDQVELGGGAVLNVVAPSKPFLTGTDSDLNNNSIVARLVYGNFSMLLAGDAETEAEKRMLKSGAQLKSLVLKSGHHGSSTSSSPAFLQAVSPEAVVISVGVNNDYHHPHPSTLKKYSERKLKVYRTDNDGTVTITSDGKTYSITKEK